MAKTSLPRVMLGRLMQGDEITPADIDLLVKERELSYHDLKSGKLLTENKSDPKLTIKKYISAFCNSDGGFLVIGVSDDTRAIEGCPDVIGTTPLVEWATSVCSLIAPRITPPIHYQTVKHADGLVLLIGVLRNPVWVPITIQGEETYWIRNGTQTIQAPPWLIADILLGRRIAGDIRVSFNGRVSSGKKASKDGDDMALFLPMLLENVGLTWVDQMRAGLVAWSHGGKDDIPTALAPYIDAAIGPGFRNMGLSHIPLAGVDGLRVFEKNITIQHEPIRIPNGTYTVSMGIGLYVVERNSNPRLYQIMLPDFRVDGASDHFPEETFMKPKTIELIWDRPVKVTWERTDLVHRVEPRRS